MPIHSLSTPQARHFYGSVGTRPNKVLPNIPKPNPVDCVLEYALNPECISKRINVKEIIMAQDWKTQIAAIKAKQVAANTKALNAKAEQRIRAPQHTGNIVKGSITGHTRKLHEYKAIVTFPDNMGGGSTWIKSTSSARKYESMGYPVQYL